MEEVCSSNSLSSFSSHRQVVAEEHRSSGEEAGKVASRAFRIHVDRVCCGCDGRCEASVEQVCGVCRFGPEMK
ncbi:hypothetical protein Taro_011545 [Colocasia esculenta]|uniref:Uncharacterized protein n=1 Tax=Colocasia esculenta TaxID=4460 RepID=A0A843U1N6_COLES|nr:hypothetical protein [Colocasia esculenta]